MFVVNCYLKKYSPYICRLLHNIGYTVNFSVDLDKDAGCIITDGKNKIATVYSENYDIPNNCINCNDNKEMFLFLVPLQHHNYIHQLLIDEKNNCYTFDTEEKYLKFINDLFSKGIYIHKMNENEILDKFDKNKYGWLTFSEEYIEASYNEELILPNKITVVETEKQTTWDFGRPIKLTKEGREICDQYFDDLSLGYDLCYGKAKGLAQQYTQNSFYDMIKNTREYRINYIDENG